MKFLAVAAIAALGAALSGCATLVDGVHQSVSVSTTPVQGASCTLSNSQGTWYLTSPGSATVHRTKTDLLIACTKDGYQPGNQTAIAKFGGATFGNVLMGGIIGAGVDAASGANYYYDSPISVPLGMPTTTPVTPLVTPAPAKGKPNS